MEKNMSPSPLAPGSNQPGTHPAVYQDEELSLLDLWKILRRQRLWIIAVTLLVTSGAGIYAFTSPRIYRTEIILLPPQEKDIIALNVSPFSQLTTAEVYAEFQTNLQRPSLRRLFFDENNLAAAIQTSDKKQSPASAFEQFNKLISVDIGGKDKRGFVSVFLEGKQPTLITEWVNGFVGLVERYTAKSFVETVRAKIENKKRTLEQRITMLREFAQKRRMDRIAAIKEDLIIARRLGIHEMVANIVQAAGEPSSGLAVAINAAGGPSPLYLRGTKALEAELENLRNRKSDDPFIPELRDLEEELIRLNQAQIDVANIRTARIDQQALPPRSPIKPKRRLIVVAGAILGLAAGMVTAFIRNFFQEQQKTEG